MGKSICQHLGGTKINYNNYCDDSSQSQSSTGDLGILLHWIEGQSGKYMPGS